jgi:anti-anti-sigma factor
VQNPSGTSTARLAINADRRDGIDRLTLAGELDSSSVLLLEAELNGVTHPGGAVILDLRALSSIDQWGVRAIERAARRADRREFRLFVVGHGPVLDALQASCIGHLLSGADLSDLLGSGDGMWAPISLPPLPGQRDGRPSRVAGEAS